MARGIVGRVFSIAALSWADTLVFYALAVMQNYLTDVWKISFTRTAAILNVWGGLCKILPVFLLFFAESYVGHFKMTVIASSAYSIGMISISLSAPLFLADSTGMCKQLEPNCIGQTQKTLFYLGLALLAVGISGLQVSVEPFIIEQDSDGDDGSVMKLALRISNFFLFSIISAIGVFALPRLKPGAVVFGSLTICIILVTFVFMSGWGSYRKVKPQGSPITSVCNVYVAAAANTSLSLPTNVNELYRKNDRELNFHTPTFKFLEKASIVTNPEDPTKNSWKLCSLGDVEDAKAAIRMVPMWMTCITVGIVLSMGFTYFIEQGSHMNRKLGNWKIPLQLFVFWFVVSNNPYFIICNSSEEEKEKTYEKSVLPSFGIVFGMIFSTLCCVTAAKVENRRLNSITSHGLQDRPDATIPMSIFWLVFQFALLAYAEFISKLSLESFYKNEAPNSMKNYIGFFVDGVFGLGYMCNVLLVYVVGKISERGGRSPSWFQFTLNRSRLDKYYWLLAVLSSVNLIVFIIFLACRYRYRKSEKEDQENA